MVRLRTLDPPIGVRVPASQPNAFKHLRATNRLPVLFCVPIVCRLTEKHFFELLSRGLLHGRKDVGIRV
jgi:hypothetical protein